MRVLRFDNCEDQRLRVARELVLKLVARVMVALLSFGFSLRKQQCGLPRLRFLAQRSESSSLASLELRARPQAPAISEASASAVGQRAEVGVLGFCCDEPLPA